jgi:hypothetical protein
MDKDMHPIYRMMYRGFFDQSPSFGFLKSGAVLGPV